MFKKVFYFILILKLTQARYGFIPKFYGQDSAIIVDTDKSLPPANNVALKYPPKLRLLPPFPIWRHYPRYHIIPPPPPGQIFAINTWSKNKATTTSTINRIRATSITTHRPTTTTTRTTTSTTTTSTTTTPKPTTTLTSSLKNPFLTDDEFPKELLDIAQKKLGLKSLDEIPSISELGQLLGTNSPEETLNYIKQLTSNDQGIALMKSYIESADYTDNSSDSENKNDDLEDENDAGDIEEAIKANDEDLVVVTDEDSNDDYELDNEKEEEETTLMPTLKPPNSIKEMTKKVPSNTKSSSKDYKENQAESDATNDVKDLDSLKTPILIRESIPYNYPVPIRAQSSSTTTTTTPPPSLVFLPSNSHVVHLNTPKVFIPHVKQLSRITNIPPKKIEDFLASKPKLLELANKVSRFPISYDRNSPVEAQVMTAVQKAIEQDEDLKKLLSSTATLK